MAFRVHALLVRYIIPVLHMVSGCVRSVCSGNPSNQQAGARAPCRPRTSADRRTHSGTEDRAHHRAAYGALFSGLPRRYSAHLLVCKLPACALVETKLVKTFAGARHYTDAGTRTPRTRRHNNASAEAHQCNQQQWFQGTRHESTGIGHDCGGSGATRCQGPAHRST